MHMVQNLYVYWLKNCYSSQVLYLNWFMTYKWILSKMWVCSTKPRLQFTRKVDKKLRICTRVRYWWIQHITFIINWYEWLGVVSFFLGLLRETNLCIAWYTEVRSMNFCCPWTTDCLSTILELHLPQTCNIHTNFGHYTAILIKRRCNWIGVGKNTRNKGAFNYLFANINLSSVFLC